MTVTYRLAMWLTLYTAFLLCLFLLCVLVFLLAPGLIWGTNRLTTRDDIRSVEKLPFKAALHLCIPVSKVPHLGSEPEQAEGKLGFEEKKASSGEDVICLARSSMTPEGFLASVSHLHAEKEKDSEKRRRRGKQREKPCPFHNLTGLMSRQPTPTTP